MKFFNSLKSSITKKVVGIRVEKAINELDSDKVQNIVSEIITSAQDNVHIIKQLAEDNAETIIKIVDIINDLNNPKNKNAINSIVNIVKTHIPK